MGQKENLNPSYVKLKTPFKKQKTKKQPRKVEAEPTVLRKGEQGSCASSG